MAKRESTSRESTSNKNNEQQDRNKKENEKDKKIEITPELRTIWFRTRARWRTNSHAFIRYLNSLTEEQAEELYDFSSHALFTSYPKMIQNHPELSEITVGDVDRLCMIDTFKLLVRRLGKQDEFEEKIPDESKLELEMQGSIGRNSYIIE